MENTNGENLRKDLIKMIKFVKQDFYDLVENDLKSIGQDYEKSDQKKRIRISLFQIYNHKDRRILLAAMLKGELEHQKSFIKFLDNYSLDWKLSRYDEETFEVVPTTKSEIILDKL